MKKSVLLMFAVIAMVLSGCSKDDDDFNVVSIENLSGITWYKTTVFVSETKEGELDIVTDKLSTVEVGESLKIKTNAKYCSISAYNAKGKLISSYRKEITGNKVSIKSTDIF